MTISDLYYDHIRSLETMAEAGDETAIKSLACMQLLISGWRYGDPDPFDPDDDPDGGLPLDDNVIAFPARIAA